MTHSLPLRTILCFVALAHQSVFAQNTSVNTRPDRGWLPTGVFSASDLGTVNQVSGNLTLRIPITALAPDRGAGHAFQLELGYNSALYDTSPAIASTVNSLPYLRLPLGASVHGGWNYNYNYGLEYEYRAQPSAGGLSCGTMDGTTWRMHKMYLRTPDGALHLLVPFGLSDTNDDGFFAVGPSRNKSGCPNNEPVPTGDMNYSTVDGTYIRVTIGYSSPPNNPGENDWLSRQWRAFFPDGSEVRGFGGASDTLVDRHGNEMRVYPDVEANGNVTTVIEDSVGRAIRIEAVLANEVKAKDLITKFGFGGNAFTWEVTWGKITVAAKRLTPASPRQPLEYICGYAPDGGEQRCGLVADLAVIEKVSFPQSIVNNANYTYDFNYASADSPENGWGELRTVSFPPRSSAQGFTTRAEATFTYRWDNYTNPITAALSRNVTLSLENPIASRKIRYHDGLDTRSERTTYSFGNTSSVKVDSSGLVTAINFFNREGFSWTRGLVYQINGPLGRSVLQSWSQNPIYGYSNANPYVDMEATTLPGPNGAPSEKISRREFSYDRNGNLRRLTERDFSNFIVRTTTHRYLFPTDEATSNPVPAYGGVNTFAYWNPLIAARAINSRFSTEIRQGSANGPVRAYREFSFDDHGNVTQRRAWDSLLVPFVTPPASVPAQTPAAILDASNSVITKTEYTDGQGTFQKGNVTATIDAKNTRTTAAYGLITGCSGANPTLTNLYPTQRVEAASTSAARTFQATYDCNTGVVTTERDADNDVTSTTTYDGLGRPLVRTEAGLRSSSQTYYDSNFIDVFAQDLSVLNDRSLVTVSHRDDLGRLYLARTTPDVGTNPAWDDPNPENVGNVVKYLRKPGCRLDNLNPDSCALSTFHYEAVSNPSRAGQTSTNGWSVSRMDTLGRVLDITTYSAPSLAALPPPWGTGNNGTAITGMTTYTYDGDLTTIADPAGKTRRTRVDALGRLVEVIEDPAGLNYSTLYTYDVLDNLTNVSQGVQTRLFSYSSLSRLLSANNPENGVVTYAYDPNGNLLTKTDQKPVTVTMSYDPLNRLVAKTYTDGTPSSSYTYDTCAYGRGRLCSAGNSVATSGLNYDKLGRVINSTQTTAGVPYLFRYQYSPGGNLTAIEYPSATVDTPTQPLKVSYSYGPSGRVVGIRKGESTSSDSFLASAAYWPSGAPAALQFGNGLLEETTLNSRQQVTDIRARVGVGGATLWRSELTYNPDANNGNISGQTISGTHGLNAFAYSQTYTYDNLNRLETVLDSGVGVAVDGRSQIFVYDRYGNRALKQNSFKQNGAVEVPTPTAAAVEAVFPGNRLNNCCNAAGDATALNGKTIAYDGEHRVISVAYTDVSSVNILLEYFYDADGRRIRATKKSNGTLTSSTVFVYDSAGQLMAEYTTPSPASEGRQYLTQDHLGSTRLVTKATGTDLVFSRHDFMPFGEELARGANGYGPSALAMKFTGKERDAETGLDYFSARYMSAAQGRFTSPDVPFADQWEKNPQSWNLYSYARNNPLRFVDPTGRCSQAAGGYTDEGSGLFPGPCSGGTIGDSNNNTNSVTVTGKKGNAVGAFVLNALFALDSTANNYFAWMFKERPKLLENTPTTKEFVGQAAAATVLVGTMMIGPSGGAQAPLRLIHSEATLSKTILDGLRKKSTQEIIDTLKPGLEEGLKVKPDGRVMDGNHRIKVLMERGVDVNSLPREVLK